MAGGDRLEQIRIQAANLCRRPQMRDSSFTFAEPTDWSPHAVLNPEDDEPFTEDGAWNFIADCLENPAVVLREVTLKRPPGAVAQFFVVQAGEQSIYVKFHLVKGRIRGRSFHISHNELPR